MNNFNKNDKENKTEEMKTCSTGKPNINFDNLLP